MKVTSLRVEVMVVRNHKGKSPMLQIQGSTRTRVLCLGTIHHVLSVVETTRVSALWARMCAICVVNRDIILKIVGSKMFALKVKWLREEKLLEMPKEGMVKFKVKLEEDKLPRTTASMLFMVAKTMRM